MSVKQNDWIEVEYTGKLKSGEVFDTSKDRQPLKFKVGSGMVIPGFDSAVLDMEIGSEKKFTILHTEAYGPKNENTVEIPKTSFKDLKNIEKDKSYNFMTDLGPIKIDVKEVLEDKIKAIVNHPLAGEDLDFEIKVVKVLSEDEALECEKELKAQSSGCSCSGHNCDDTSCDDKK